MCRALVTPLLTLWEQTDECSLSLFAPQEWSKWHHCDLGDYAKIPTSIIMQPL